MQELYGCYTFIPEGDGTKVTYKLRVEPGAFSKAMMLPPTPLCAPDAPRARFSASASRPFVAACVKPAVLVRRSEGILRTVVAMQDSRCPK